MSIQVRVSGEPRSLAEGTTVAALVAGLPPRGVAVARNGEVVRRDAWGATVLLDGDEVEIVKPIQGGAR
jgi:sulfur carrier protein